jgi:tetratricopeptide (TPR) repeat protein
MLLAKSVGRLVSWGEVQYGQEMADRYRKTGELYPSCPSIVGTAATALISVGLHELSIQYADQAISMEATTEPWAKARYAKGRALFELGREDEAIEALTTATGKAARLGSSPAGTPGARRNLWHTGQRRTFRIP